MMSVMHSFLTVLAVLTGCTGNYSGLSKPENRFSGPLPKQQEVNHHHHQQQLNTSAINTALAFEPYHDLATRTTAEPGVQQQQQQQQRNILFSPLGLASALAQLSRVSGSESRSQALKSLGLTANSTEQGIETTLSALSHLHYSLTLQEGGGGGGVQRAESEAGAGKEAWIGVAERVENGGAGAGNRAETHGDDGAEAETGIDDGLDGGDQLKVWSSLHTEGKPSLDYDRFMSSTHPGPSPFNISFETLMKDLKTSDKLELNNYVYFKGRLPFKRRLTVPRSFQLNATSSAGVAMMFKDDSSEVMILYDTNCSATVVRLAQSGRVASLLLLPKAELRPVEDCLSDSRMSFWLSNLKPGRAEILFPKFQLRKSYSLESLLRTSGVSTIFTDSADFSRISQKTLRLIKAPHEVLLEVEEAKSDDGGRHGISLDFSIPPRITFNRPFIFIIYDDLTGLVLLIGRVVDPTE